MGHTLPKEFNNELERFTFTDMATNKTLKEFRIMGGAGNTYIQKVAVYDTYEVSFGDRYGRADSDLDFLVKLRK